MFDILWHEGKDLRSLPLMKRKQILRRLIPARDPYLLYVDHTEDGENLYKLVCSQDLEGVVMKHKASRYGESWIKVKNPAYSQLKGRHELFDSKMVKSETLDSSSNAAWRTIWTTTQR